MAQLPLKVVAAIPSADVTTFHEYLTYLQPYSFFPLKVCKNTATELEDSDIIIIDYQFVAQQLPTLLDELSTSSVPQIFLLDTEDALNPSLQIGGRFSEKLTKPFLPSELFSTIAELDERRTASITN